MENATNANPPVRNVRPSTNACLATVGTSSNQVCALLATQQSGPTPVCPFSSQ